jgi:drug/metabolite transporter (DMT)-like permease
MTLLALVLVLCAAVLHATWNLAAKRVGSGLPFVFGVGVVMTLYYVPIVVGLIVWRGITLNRAELAVIGVSTLLKTGYALYLQRAYRSGDFSLIYPIVRGSAPVLATIGAIIFLGEKPSPLGAAGGLLIVVSIFFLSHGERLWQQSTAPNSHRLAPALLNALIAGSFIASFTVWDRNAMGYHRINPVIFDGMTNIGLTVLLAPFAWPRRTEVFKIWRDHRREVLIMATLSPLAYVLVLTALSFTPVSYVAPAREFSILIGAYFGARFLKEPESPRRVWCACGMILGLTILAVA